MTKFILEVDQKCHQSYACSVALDFCTKSYRKLVVSQSKFFVPFRELISRADRWKTPKLRTIAHQYLVSKTVLWICDTQCPSHSFTTFSPKKKKNFQWRLFIIISHESKWGTLKSAGNSRCAVPAEIHSICTDRRDLSPAAGLQVSPTSDTCQSVAILMNRRHCFVLLVFLLFY